MVEYFTEAYWEELASLLNDDESFQEDAGDLETELMFVAEDKDRAFRLVFDNGSVTAETTDEDAEADFKFIGPYDEWVKNHKGDADFQRQIMMGKLKFKGSMGEIMSLRKQLGSAMKKAGTIDAEY